MSISEGKTPSHSDRRQSNFPFQLLVKYKIFEKTGNSSNTNVYLSPDILINM